MTFEELGVSEPLCRAIAELGFENPMPVQEKVIPHLLDKEATLWRSHRPAQAKPPLSDYL